MFPRLTAPRRACAKGFLASRCWTLDLRQISAVKDEVSMIDELMQIALGANIRKPEAFRYEMSNASEHFSLAARGVALYRLSHASPLAREKSYPWLSCGLLGSA